METVRKALISLIRSRDTQAGPMAGRIPQGFIDDLLARVDIVDVIDSYVPLRKAGKNHQALCPFHEEENAFVYGESRQAVLPLLRLRRRWHCHYLYYGIQRIGFR